MDKLEIRGREPTSLFKKVQGLYQENNKITSSEVLETFSCNEKTVRNYISILRKGYYTQHQKKEQRAREQGYTSRYEKETKLVKERGKKVGKMFNSQYDYQKYCAEQKGLSYKEYNDSLAQEKGYESYAKYQLAQQAKNKQTKEGQAFSGVIHKGLHQLGATQLWLAVQLDITLRTIERYASGRVIPNEERQLAVFRTLQLPYNTIEDVLRGENVTSK